METKILLRLIIDDISHLQGIANEFSQESLPAADEVELAQVRVGALLRQLELLHKSLVKLADPAPAIETDEDKGAESLESNPQLPEPEVMAVEPFFATEEKEIKPLPVEKDVAEGHNASITESEIISAVKDIKADVVEDSQDHWPKIQGDTPVESQIMVNELLAQDKSESGFQIIPISSMWDGIGINDRIQYTRELFGNNSSKFEDAVNALNQLSTIQEVVNYLKLNFKWHKSEASQKFLVLVKRRFTN